MVGARDAEIALQLLEDVVQRRRNRDARLHRETQAVRLSGAVVGILAEHHDLGLFERGRVERGEDVRGRGEDARALLPAFAQEVRQLAHVVALQVVADARFPRGLELDAVLAHQPRRRADSHRTDIGTCLTPGNCAAPAAWPCAAGTAPWSPATVPRSA